MRRDRKFARATLKDELDPEVYKKLVHETKSLLKRRYEKAKGDDNILDFNFNPFLLLITAPVYNLFSPFEIAERLQLGTAFHGDDTAFGKFGENRLLPLFGAVPCAEKKLLEDAKQNATAWEPIDCQIEVEGKRYLVGVKSGPMTVNQAHANAMVDKFPLVHEKTGCPIILGIMYGRYEQLSNKPNLVERELGNPDWFDYLVGADFWEFVSGVKNVHKEVFRAIREAQTAFGEEHKDETFQEMLVGNRLKVAASLRKAFNVQEEADFWETLFSSMF